MIRISNEENVVDNSFDSVHTKKKQEQKGTCNGFLSYIYFICHLWNDMQRLIKPPHKSHLLTAFFLSFSFFSLSLMKLSETEIRSIFIFFELIEHIFVCFIWFTIINNNKMVLWLNLLLKWNFVDYYHSN